MYQGQVGGYPTDLVGSLVVVCFDSILPFRVATVSIFKSSASAHATGLSSLCRVSSLLFFTSARSPRLHPKGVCSNSTLTISSPANRRNIPSALRPPTEYSLTQSLRHMVQVYVHTMSSCSCRDSSRTSHFHALVVARISYM